MQYSYPKISGGYRYNLLKRCLHEVGIEPIGCGDVGEETVLQFDRGLTTSEQFCLDVLMRHNPTFPPASKTVFKIVDIGEKLDWFNKQTGIEFTLYCTGDGVIDILELHTSEVLTQSEIEHVIQVFSQMIVYDLPS